jgi:hypothetical protein
MVKSVKMPSLKLTIASDAANDVALRANALEIHERTRSQRPKNTNLNYIPKQKEYLVSNRLTSYVNCLISTNFVGMVSEEGFSRP